MPTLTVTRDEATGKLVGSNDVHQRGWLRFAKTLRELVNGATLVVKWWAPRSPRFHRFHFAILGAIFDAQEQFEEVDALRLWLQVGTGHCKYVPGPKGRMVALPLSINFESMDDDDFRAHHDSVRKFALSTYATRFLWPHLSDLEGGEMMQVVFDSFELKPLTTIQKLKDVNVSIHTSLPPSRIPLQQGDIDAGIAVEPGDTLYGPGNNAPRLDYTPS